jgi:hypothetical protein
MIDDARNRERVDMLVLSPFSYNGQTTENFNPVGKVPVQSDLLYMEVKEEVIN